ncbi:MAG: nucleoside 2-deoxyribosyltransferase [Nitrospirae bacterium]|nr:nucleoside 2-deoxyribosyltransferase [Nitrospirota bacterium]MBF0535844.1 nucleoside 2-deoxyribosyltransferase [Nitrospirota bacterium]MBF0617822.1 nucleoside 2-deoxyribosyltransferase [Nitrospirota bacterium]
MLKTIYLAGPLFSKAERRWVNLIKGYIKRFAEDKGLDVNIINPQELISYKEILALGENAKFEIFNRCRSHLDEVDILVAVLDGSQVDDGTAWEVGYFTKHKQQRQKIVGIRTDVRNVGEFTATTVNAMIECSCDKIVDTIEKLLKTLFIWLYIDIKNGHQQNHPY